MTLPYVLAHREDREAFNAFGDRLHESVAVIEAAVVISNPPFIVLYSSLCSRTLRSLRSLRFNHSNATGIDMSFEALRINSTANDTLLQFAGTGEVLAQVFGANNAITSLDFVAVALSR